MELLSDNPIVSVIIPVYNAEPYLKIMLDSINKQTYENYEFIFIDDQSTDNSIKILQLESSKNNRIKIATRTRLPKGAPTCRNIGLSLANGKYLIYIDSDDLISKTFLEDRVRFMEDNPECDYATFRGGTVTIIDDKIKYGTKVWGEAKSKDMLSDFLSTQYPFSIWNNIYRREIFKDFYWDEKLKVYQDFDFAVIAILSNFNHAFANNKNLDYFYRSGVINNISSNFITEEKYQSTKYLFNKIWTELSKKKDNIKYKKSFSKFFILQYTRLLVKGSDAQIIDYITFCQKYLNKLTILKMKLVYKIQKVFLIFNRHQEFIIKLLVMIFYYPENIILFLKHKVKFH